MFCFQQNLCNVTGVVFLQELWYILYFISIHILKVLLHCAHTILLCWLFDLNHGTDVHSDIKDRSTCAWQWIWRCWLPQKFVTLVIWCLMEEFFINSNSNRLGLCISYNLYSFLVSSGLGLLLVACISVQPTTWIGGWHLNQLPH